jgi:photosystem II stability/assembly factor-like uncharacterized protein
MRALFSILIIIIINPINLFSQWTKTSLSFNTIYFPSEVAAIDDYLFVGSSEGSVYRSSDGGNIWEAVNNGLPSSNVNRFFYETVNDTTFIYTATDSGLFRSNNYGDEWESLNNNISDKNLITVYKTENYIFLSTVYSKEYRSTNSGLTWEEISIGTNNQKVNSFIRYNNLIFAGLSDSSKHVYKSGDFGLTWIPSDNGLIDNVTAIEKLNSRLFASFYGIVYQSTDAGINWVNAITGIPVGYPIPDMKSFGDLLFISTLSGVYTLQGETNEAINISGNLPSPAGVVRIDVNDNYMIIGLFDYNFVKNEIWIRPTSDITSTKETVSLIPKNIELGQNYPNPFNPSTKISWKSPVSSHQTLKVYDVLGNEVATLVDEYKTAGSYSVDFDASNLSSGFYFYKLQVGSFTASNKMIYLK